MTAKITRQREFSPLSTACSLNTGFPLPEKNWCFVSHPKRRLSQRAEPQHLCVWGGGGGRVVTVVRCDIMKKLIPGREQIKLWNVKMRQYAEGNYCYVQQLVVVPPSLQWNQTEMKNKNLCLCGKSQSKHSLSICWVRYTSNPYLTQLWPAVAAVQDRVATPFINLGVLVMHLRRREKKML